MFDVISLGTATLDVFLRSTGMEVAHGDICVRSGAKLEVNEINFESGGGGTNSAVTFARQGLKTTCIVQIADDFAGQKIIADLEKERLPTDPLRREASEAGINTDLINIQKGNYTDYATILWVGDGGRTILIYRGKTRLEITDVPWDRLDTKWFYVSSLEGNLEIVQKLTELGKPIAWNPGGRELKEREAVLSLLPKITQLNVNKEEMMELVGGIGEIGELLRKAQELPCQYIVITDDKRGAYLWDKANSVWWHSGIFEDSLRYETTGAGDSFGSGLVAGLIKNLPLPDCLWLASANASSVVSLVGAKKGILRENDLKDWPKEKLKIEKVNF